MSAFLLLYVIHFLYWLVLCGKSICYTLQMVAVDHDLVVHTLQQPTAKANLAV